MADRQGPAASGPGRDVAVRLAGAGDGPAVAKLRAAWSAEWHGTAADEAFQDRFAAWWADEGRRRLVWLAWAGEVPVGTVTLITLERMPWPGKPASRWGHLSNAYVLPDWRSQGVGTVLVDALLSHARAAGYARVALSPSERSVPFYRRAGFGPATSLLLTDLTVAPAR